MVDVQALLDSLQQIESATEGKATVVEFRVVASKLEDYLTDEEFDQVVDTLRSGITPSNGSEPTVEQRRKVMETLTLPQLARCLSRGTYAAIRACLDYGLAGGLKRDVDYALETLGIFQDAFCDKLDAAVPECAASRAAALAEKGESE